MRRKLMLAFLSMALLPLLLLAYLNHTNTRDALIDDANQKLINAASESAASIDAFIVANLDAVRTESQLPAFQEYLSGDPSDAELQQRAEDILWALSRRDPRHIRSIALLDHYGQVVLDTDEAGLDHDESHYPYFQVTQANQEPYVSPIQFNAINGEPSLVFSASILGDDGQQLGALRVRYHSEVLQELVTQKNDLIGHDSFGVLFDEQFIHLAHGKDADLRFTVVGRADQTRYAELLGDHRLPERPMEVLFVDLPDLEANLASAMDQDTFSNEDIATGDRLNQVGVTHLDSQPWLMAFFQPRDVFLAPVEEQTRNTLVLLLVIAGAAVLAAVLMGQTLATPITRLSRSMSAFTAGDLTARSKTRNRDEIGQLAADFNLMAARVGSLLTSLRQHEEELETALAAQKELNELKSRFVSMVSHEFRKPLSAMLMSNELLGRYLETGEREKAHVKVVSMREHVKRLTELLDDVLALAQAEDVSARFDPQPLALAAFLRRMVDEAQLIDGWAHQINLRADDGCDGVVLDAEQMRRMLMNLLSNAAKYSAVGGEVSLGLACTDDQIEITVQDHGIGIPAEDQKRLFESFHRASNVGKIQGTGLGLVLVKHAVDLHGGNITVQSAEGQGTTFTVSLPLQHVDEPDIRELVSPP